MRVLALTLAVPLAFAVVANAGQQITTADEPRVPRAGMRSPHWQIGISSFGSDGRYGTDGTTRLVYTSLSVRRMFPRGDVSVRVPWLNIRSESTVFVFRGIPQPTTPTRGQSTRADTTRAAAVPVATRQTTTESGLGDVGIVGRYFLVEDSSAHPAVDLTARLELPTGTDHADWAWAWRPSKWASSS